MLLKYGVTMLCDQNCGVQRGHRQADTQKHTHTHTQSDRKVKTEESKILSNDLILRL